MVGAKNKRGQLWRATACPCSHFLVFKLDSGVKFSKYTKTKKGLCVRSRRAVAVAPTRSLPQRPII